MTVKYNSNLICGIDFSQSEYREQSKSYFEWIIESLISNFAFLPSIKECIITDDSGIPQKIKIIAYETMT